MASTGGSTQVFDPFLTFNFQVKWDSKYVAAVNKVTGLDRMTEVVRFRSGGQPEVTFKQPGQSDYGPITLEQGVSFDTTFEQWANKIWYYPNTNAFGQEMSSADFRKNVTLEVYNLPGQLVLRYNLYNCWPSEYKPLPELDAESNMVALASLTLQNQGWQRDTSVTPPPPVTVNQPSS